MTDPTEAAARCPQMSDRETKPDPFMVLPADPDEVFGRADATAVERLWLETTHESTALLAAALTEHGERVRERFLFHLPHEDFCALFDRDGETEMECECWASECHAILRDLPVEVVADA